MRVVLTLQQDAEDLKSMEGHLSDLHEVEFRALGITPEFKAQIVDLERRVKAARQVRAEAKHPRCKGACEDVECGEMDSQKLRGLDRDAMIVAAGEQEARAIRAEVDRDKALKVIIDLTRNTAGGYFTRCWCGPELSRAAAFVAEHEVKS